MTRIEALLEALGWSRNYAARRIGVPYSTMRYWAQGTNSAGNAMVPPEWVTAYLHDCLTAVEMVKPRGGGAA